MSHLTDRIATAENWPEPDAAGVAALLATPGPPLALLFIGRGGSRRETDDVAVVLRDLARAGRVRPALTRAMDAGIIQRFGIVAMPSLVLASANGTELVPLIADWQVYVAALARLAAREG